MPNLAGLSVWYQKTHKPTWWMAWQALTQVSDLMFTSNLLDRYYAYNAFVYMFNDADLVYAGVLASLIPAQQVLVYTDPILGLNEVGKLSVWVLANENGVGSIEWNYIVNYYSAKGIDMSSAIYQIIGPSSILQMIISEQRAAILVETSYNQKIKPD